MQSDISTGAYAPVRKTRPRIDGRYELQSEIGSGSLGSVHRCLDTRTGGEVAIKLLHEHHRQSRREVETFWREARAGGLVDHPNVTRVLDSGKDPILHDFVVMELLAGTTLESKLSEGKLLPQQWSLDIMDQMLRGLGAMHEAGLVHRDIKPENILIERRRQVDAGQIERVDHVKLCDFGLAKLPDGDHEIVDTLAGTLCGTPEYIAPEQAQGRPVEPAADIYSCGVILYQLITGQLPFTGSSPMAIAAQHIGRPVPPPRRHCPDLDLRIERIIIKAMAKRPADRFASAEAMRAALEALSDPNSPPIDLGRAGEVLRAPRLRWDEEPTQLFRPALAEDERTEKRLPPAASSPPRTSSSTPPPPVQSQAAEAPRSSSPELQRRARMATGIVLGLPVLLLASLAWWIVSVLRH